ncbi:amidase [Elioraea rosea]|uniref:amidase n=1 Tax=Elioraea rosea TaxID=2492390 RepID=UPI00118625DB|nr:amidase [Elioraea rosea]
MTEAWRMTATEARAAMAAGRLTPVALMESCLARIAEREPSVRAFAWLDRDHALAQARRADPARPLGGLPIGVKDVIETADMPTQNNSAIWAGYRPRGDAACVAWARAAGAVVMGKTVTTEFATRHPGPTRNPANLAHTPGGSSSGSAAAVADGFVPFAFGTQTAGSIIRPAAYCGVVGYKPTYGMISRMGMKIMADSLDTMGCMARSVADVALFAGTLSNRDLGDPDRVPGAAPRIGLCRSPSWKAAAPETQALMERVAAALAKAGAKVTDHALPDRFAALEEAHPVIMNGESARSIGWELTTHRHLVSAALREKLEPMMDLPGEKLEAALATAKGCIDAFPAAMEALDVLVTPSAPGEAPEGIGWTGDPAFNYLWTTLRVPCVTVPAGTGPKGLPLGIQIVGRMGEDRAVLAWARWVQNAIA